MKLKIALLFVIAAAAAVVGNQSADARPGDCYSCWHDNAACQTRAGWRYDSCRGAASQRYVNCKRTRPEPECGRILDDELVECDERYTDAMEICQYELDDCVQTWCTPF